MPCQPSDLQYNGTLLIGDSTSDNGTRPFSDGDNEPYWNSPFVFLSGGPGLGTYKAGTTCTVNVTVKNISQQPLININVETWVCNFTMGVTPASSLASSNPGSAPMTGFWPGPLMSGTLQNIAMEQTWTPTAADAALNGGHVCIAANCWADPPDRGATLSSMGDVFNFLCNDHHAQRNIMVQTVPMGGMQKKFVFPIFVTNPASHLSAVSHVQMNAVTGTPALRDLAHTLKFESSIVEAQVAQSVRISQHAGQLFHSDMLQIEPHVAATSQAAMSLIPAADFKNRFFVPVDDKSFAPLTLSSHPAQDFTLESDSFGKGRTLTVNLAKDQVKPINVSVELGPAHKPGDMLVFDILQRLENGHPVGGARLIFIMTA